MQQQQQQLPQVTIKLQHHAQLEDNDLNTYRSSGFVCSDNPFVNNITTETFKIKPSSTTNVRECRWRTIWTLFRGAGAQMHCEDIWFQKWPFK